MPNLRNHQGYIRRSEGSNQGRREQTMARQILRNPGIATGDGRHVAAIRIG